MKNLLKFSVDIWQASVQGTSLRGSAFVVAQDVPDAQELMLAYEKIHQYPGWTMRWDTATVKWLPYAGEMRGIIVPDAPW